MIVLIMDEEILLSLTSSINKLGTSLRIQSERLFEFENMMTKDVNDAITNLENSFESVLETSHSADDCLRKLKLVKKQNNIYKYNIYKFVYVLPLLNIY